MTEPQQGGLFDAPPTAGRARRADPDTSRAAARSLDARKRCAEVLAVLRSLGGSATAWEVTADLLRQGHHAQQNAVNRRLTDLEEMGEIARTSERRTGATGRSQIVWTTTSQGASQ